MTLRQHDLVAMVETPNNGDMASALLAPGRHGNVGTTTPKALTQQDFVRSIENLPAS